MEISIGKKWKFNNLIFDKKKKYFLKKWIKFLKNIDKKSKNDRMKVSKKN